MMHSVLVAGRRRDKETLFIGSPFFFRFPFLIPVIAHTVVRGLLGLGVLGDPAHVKKRRAALDWACLATCARRAAACSPAASQNDRELW